MITRRFIKRSVIYTFAGMLPMASAIILLPFYLEYLPLEQYGQLAFYLAFSMFLQIIVTFSFDSSLYIYYHDYKEQPRQLARLMSSAFIFMGILAGGLFVGTVLGGPALLTWIGGDKGLDFYPYGFFSVVTAIFQAFFKVHSSFLQTQEKPETFFWANLISFSLIAIFSIGGLMLFPGELIGPIGGRMVAAIVAGCWALFRIFSRFGLQYDYRFLRTTFRINNSSFIFQLQQWSINYLDRLLITYYLTLQDVGAYDFVWKCLILIDLIIGALNNSFFPRVISTLAGQVEKRSTPLINRYYHGLTAAIILMVTGAIFVLPLLDNFGLIRDEYESALQYVPYMGVIYLVRGMRYYFGMPYSILKFTRPLPVIYLAISALKIGLIVYFIPTYGLMAVIAASFASSLLEVRLLYSSIRQRFAFKFNLLKMVVSPMALCALILTLETTIDIHKDVLHAAYLAFALLFLLWLYRKEIRLLATFRSKGAEMSNG